MSKFSVLSTKLEKGGMLYIKKPIPILAVRIEKKFEVQTIEGILKGKAGDYLIQGIKGELYPCDKEIFEESYEMYFM